MSNEYKDWVIDQECDRAVHHAAKSIYNYAYGMFFGTTQEQKDFRAKWGSNGTESQVLNYIWGNFIEPYEEEGTWDEEQCVV